MRIHHLGFVLGGMLLPLSALAHDLWLERQADGYLLYQGHHHTDHADHDLEPYGEDFVTRAVCVQVDGELRELAVAAGYPASFPAPCAALVVSGSSGIWSKTVYGTKHHPPGGLSGVVGSWLSLESVKRLDAWSPALSRPLSPELELVTLNDPFALQVGDQLHLLVTYRGQPRPGVVVVYDDETRGITDSDGHLDLPLRHAGMQRISGSFSEPNDESDVDQTLHTAVLHFELAGSSPP